MKRFFVFVLALAAALPCSAEVGIYRGRLPVTRLNTGFYYRTSSENCVSAARRINIPGLFQYIVFDSETGNYTLIAASRYGLSFTTYDFTQYPLDAFRPFRGYCYTVEVDIAPEVMLDEKGKGAVSFRSYQSRSGDVDSNGSNETALVDLAYTTGRIRPFRLRGPSRNLVTMTKTPLLLTSEGGGVRHQSLAVQGSYNRVDWEPGATFSSQFQKTRFRFDRKLSAAANDPAGTLVDGYFPGSYEYAVALLTNEFDTAGYLSYSIDPDTYGTIYFR